MASGSAASRQRVSTVSQPSSKPWATMWVFCGILALLFLSKFASGSYLYAMVTTIEKAFGLSATEIAGLKSMGEAKRKLIPCVEFVINEFYIHLMINAARPSCALISSHFRWAFIPYVPKEA